MRQRGIGSLPAFTVFLSASLSLWLTPAAWAESHPITPQDVVRLRQARDAQISPDGSWVVFVVSQPSEKIATRNAAIWLVSTAGGEPRKFTSGPGQDESPRWSPDGRKIAFLSDRAEAGKSQIYIISPAGGEAVQLTKTDSSVSEIRWSPDGRRIAYLMTDPPTNEEQKRSEAKDDAVVLDQTFKHARLYTVEVESQKTQPVTPGAYTVWDYDWSPDGTQFVIMTTDTPKIDDSYIRRRIELISASGGSPTLLVPNQGKMLRPTWSPDGSMIAYLAGRDDGREPYAGGVFVVRASGGKPRSVTETYPATFTHAQWMPDNQNLLCTAIQNVYSHVLLVSTSPEPSCLILTNEHKAVLRSNPTLSRDGRRIAFVREDARHPADVYTMRLSDGRATGLTELNRQAAELQFGETEVVRWKAEDDLEIEGVLVKPLGYEPGKSYPLIVQVHGGPESAELNGFHGSYSDWAFLLSAGGYAVLLPNYRGSIGRGSAFARADQGDMGGKEFRDIMAGVDAMIQRGIADGQRLGIGGWSYGGYMSAWAVTQTDRFDAAVMGAGIADWVSFMTQTEIPYENAIAHWAHEPFSNPELYRQRSPVTHIERVRAPVLVVHGQSDLRVPLPQGEEFYQRLKFRGVETQMVTYPREPHGFQETTHQLDVMRRVVEWFDQHVKQ
jgi:dipeptidyl aminopeptidase/acylaminoacyl peptidase